MGAEFSLNIIPDEILLNIIRHLDHRTLLSTALPSCKRISRACIRPIEDEDRVSTFLYYKCNIEMLSGIVVPKELIINVLTFDSDSSFESGEIYLMSIKYSAEHLTYTGRLGINKFFNKFKTLQLKSLKCLMLPKMPPCFVDGTNAITCHQMESLYVESHICQYNLDKLIYLKKLHFILNPGCTHKIGLFPPNLECLAVSKSIEEGPTPSELKLTLYTDACTKLKHM